MDTLRLIRVLSKIIELLDTVELAPMNILPPIFAEAETSAEGWITEIQVLKPRFWIST